MSTDENESDVSRQNEEIEALSAIYGDDFLAVNETEKLFDIRIRHEDDSWWSMTLQVLLPRNYPSTAPPVFEVHAAWLSDSDEFVVRDQLYSIYQENKDELVVFQWVEAIREFMNEKAVEYADTRQLCEVQFNDVIPDEDCQYESDGLSLECLQLTTDHDSTSLKPETDLPEILHGEPITDRKSTFQAHLARVLSEQQMEDTLRELKKTRKIAHATHNIVAYRIMKKDSQVVIQDFDDDGEHHAGSRLLHLLQILDVQNYMIVVSRWFGGILLGPDRFKHINNCARKLLKSAKVIQEQSTRQHNKDGKQKRKLKK